ncbi:putative surface protein SACOL0050 [Pollicipes pollicipes]|uniref:putative surface protein SACOL0050 n=1 Tax=Pollicipes pollicipes TaxID=41117 RepID=UPI0018855878|nr:putative surface protein SACOL0050 [Pollicipes pollicipes]
MTSLRAVLVLALVATAYAAPAVHQVAEAGRSHHEEAGPEHTGMTPAMVESTAAEGAAESQPDVEVSVSTSTSMEITAVTSSVSEEMTPMPDQALAGEAQATAEEAPAAEEETKAAEEEAPVAEEETKAAEEEALIAEKEVKATEEDVPVAEVEAAPAELEEEEGAEVMVSDLGDVASNEIEDSTNNDLQMAAEASVDVAEEQEEAAEPTAVPQMVEVATSVSMKMTETMMSVSSEMNEVEEEREQEESSGDGEDQVQADVAYLADTTHAVELAQDFDEGSGVEADFAGSGMEADFEGSASGDEFAIDISSYSAGEEASGFSAQDETEASGDDTTKGTLIFDLGAGASDELHDLVQQTVLEALMDEGLLSATEVSPVIQAEGSGIVFLDSSGSGDGDGDSAPFVSIHF